MRYIPLFISVMMVLQLAEGRQCSYSSLVRKYYLTKIADLREGELLVEARFSYRNRSDISFSFEVIRLWNDDNGSVLLNDNVNVKLGEAENDDSVKKCFEELSNKDYLLVLHKNGAGYYPVLPPLPIKSYHKRKETWKKWCAISPNNCRLKISRAEFPASKILERNEMIMIPCRASSMLDIHDLRWLKDGKVIENTHESAYGLSGISVRSIDEGNSYLIIQHASAMHAGTYSCVASDGNGRVELKGKFMFDSDSSALTTCPLGKENFCLNGGSCRGLKGVPGEVVCICKSSFEGARCQHVESRLGQVASDMYIKENQNLKNSVTALTVVLIVISCCLAIALFSLYKVSCRRRDKKILESAGETSQTKSLNEVESETFCMKDS